jgi:Protein of unknown function (DUF1592)/Protein of unknown function (DUF1588)/Protein of unknown function (DUF1595)/Protein of unknown function (DUF1585)/Protein of unknown function (DUF1587)
MFRPLRVFAGTVAVLGVAGLAGGCNGAIGPDRGGSGPNSPGGPGTSPGTSGGSNPGANGGSNPGTNGGTSNPTTGMLDDSGTVPGPAPLRRLTLVEYQNTVRDLLGIDASAVSLKGLPSDQDSSLSGYFRGSALTTGTDARTFMNLSNSLGELAAGKAGALVPCNPIPSAGPAQDACADQFIEKFGLRAFRRPLSNDEKAALKKLYQAQRGPDVGASFEQTIGTMVAAMLQTPYFLYHWELGPNAPLKDVKGDPKIARLNSYEMASRLSYLFWTSMPDDKLFEAAAAGKLNSPEEIGQAARRLLEDGRAKDAIADFHMQWLEVGSVADLQKDPSFTNWTPAVAAAAAREVAAFANGVFFGPKADGKLDSLIASPRSYLDAGLAKLYGVTGVTGTDMKEVDVGSANRAGVFTKAAFLATKADAGESIPPLRGDLLLKRAMCIHLVVPPTLPVPAVQEPSPDKTTRERYSVHSADQCARACHELIDPVGFAFENFDAVGAFRSTENNKPVDASGSLKLDSGVINFKNATELVTGLSKAPEVQACMVKQWLRYGLKRHELDSEEPSIKALEASFKAASYDMRELLVALTKTRAFTHRALSDGEVTR